MQDLKVLIDLVSDAIGMTILIYCVIILRSILSDIKIKTIDAQTEKNKKPPPKKP